jgi:protein ImuA
MALVARRRQQAEAQGKPLLWAAAWRDIAEGGWPYGPGLRQLGLDPAHLILVEARRDSEVLWAIEEGLRSGALAGVIGSLSRLDQTAARRLVLATSAHVTPCLLVTPAGTPGVQVAMSRWRISASPGAAHPLEPALPGRLRFSLTLERCRGREAGRSWIVEWSDASFRFRLAAPLADRAALPRVALGGAG